MVDSCKVSFQIEGLAGILRPAVECSKLDVDRLSGPVWSLRGHPGE